jgi:hypothetical protein
MNKGGNAILFESDIISQVSICMYYLLNSMAVLVFVSIVFTIGVWGSGIQYQYSPRLLVILLFLSVMVIYISYISWVGARVYIYHISCDDECLIVRYRDGQQLLTREFLLTDVNMSIEPRGRNSPVLIIKALKGCDFIIEQKINKYWTKSRMHEVAGKFAITKD